MGRELQVGRTRANGDDYSARNDRWLTPLPVIRALGGFDLDPCGAPGHDTAAEVWTPEEIGDGLSLPWHGRVWLNPPYGKTMNMWVRRLAEHGSGTTLLFARTDTQLFHETVFPCADGIMFLRGRITFIEAGGGVAPASSGSPSVLIAFGDGDAEKLARSGLAGHYVPLRRAND